MVDPIAGVLESTCLGFSGGVTGTFGSELRSLNFFGVFRNVKIGFLGGITGAGVEGAEETEEEEEEEREVVVEEAEGGGGKKFGFEVGWKAIQHSFLVNRRDGSHLFHTLESS
jgi:hypothetical protein